MVSIININNGIKEPTHVHQLNIDNWWVCPSDGIFVYPSYYLGRSHSKRAASNLRYKKDKIVPTLSGTFNVVPGWCAVIEVSNLKVYNSNNDMILQKKL